MSGQQTGRVTISLDGTQHRSKPGASINIGGVERKWDATDQGEAYFQEKSIPAMLKFTLVHMTDSDLLALQKFKNGTAQYITDTGRTYTISGAAVSKVGDLQNGEAEVELGGDAVVS